MGNLSKFMLGAFLTILVSQSNALTVSVRSASSKLDGIGFTVNGEKHGGMGNSYKASKMPKGTYTFGMRVKGKDVGCVDNDGKKEIKLTKTTHAVLTMKSGKCTVNIK